MPPPALLIRNGTIVTLGSHPQVLTGYSLLVEEGNIRRIAANSDFKGSFDRELDACGMVVLPGFINLHTHFYSALACGIKALEPAAGFLDVLRTLWWRLDKVLSLEECYYSALIMLLQGIRHGVTTVFDHHASPMAITGSLEQIASAVRLSGLRACLCYEVSDRDGAVVAQEGLEENSQFIRKCRAWNDSRLKALFGLHASFTLSDETLAAAAAMGRALDSGFHIHAAEAWPDQEYTQIHYHARVMERLQEHNILGRQTIAAHCVHVNRREVEVLAETETIVSHNPQSNMNNGVGICDVVGMQRAGVLVGLGTDAMSMNMTEELRVALWGQHLRQENPSIGFQEILHTLVRNNAIAARRIWGMPMGELVEGAAADIICIPYIPRTPMDEGNVYGHILFGISQESVDTTIVGGNILMHNQRLAIDVDEKETAARCRELASQVWKRME